MPNVIMADKTYPNIYEAIFGCENDPTATMIGGRINASMLKEIEGHFPLSRNGKNDSEITYPHDWGVRIVDRTYSPLSVDIGEHNANRMSTSPNPRSIDVPNYILDVGSTPYEESPLNFPGTFTGGDCLFCELTVPYTSFLSTTKDGEPLKTKEHIISITKGSFTISVAERYNPGSTKTRITDIVKKLAARYGQLLDDLISSAYIQYDLYSNELRYNTLYAYTGPLLPLASAF